MILKNLKTIVLILSISTLILSCSDDNPSENLLHNHVWEYGLSQNSIQSNGVNYTITSQFSGQLTFSNSSSYSNNIITGNIIISSNNSSIPPQNILIDPIVETGNYEHLEGPNKLITRSNTTPSLVSNYYIHEITSSKLVLKRKLEEIGIDLDGFYYITLSR